MYTNKIVCPHKNTIVKEKRETYRVKGEDITVDANVKTCLDCGEELLDMELDTENLKKAYEKYRTKYGIVSADDIIALRKKYGLSQRAFALLIGCTQATIVRYEKGALPNKTYDSVIKFLSDPANMKAAVSQHRNELDSRELAKIEQAFNAVSNDSKPLKKYLDSLPPEGNDFALFQQDLFFTLNEFMERNHLDGRESLTDSQIKDIMILSADGKTTLLELKNIFKLLNAMGKTIKISSY